MNIIWLDAISRHDVPVVGGKGANLGELTRLGLRVPPGFCITTEAYSAQVQAWNLVEKIGPLLKQKDWNKASEVAAEVFHTEAISQDLIQELLQAYHRMGQVAVAVRSSATAEDLADASFAGQQETLLNVVGDEALVEAVRRCWASLWSPRALHYRHQRGINHLETSMSVVVQEMVPAEAAGVMFTVDPTSGRTDRMLVEAALGLGEAVVSGEVTGDIYHVDRSGGLMVVDREVRRPGRPVLADACVMELCRAGLSLEEHFGCPQDVEFAVAGGKLYFLQARPITTLKQALEAEEVPPLGKLSFFQRLSTARFNERYHIAPKPLDNFAVSVVIEGSVRALGKLGLTFNRQAVERMSSQVWREGLTLPNPFPNWRFIVAPIPLSKLWKRDLVAWWEGEPRRRLVEVTQPVKLAGLSNQQLVERAERIRLAWLDVMTERLVVTFSIYVVDALLKGIIALAAGPGRISGVLADLLSGLHTRTTEVNHALWDLAVAAKRVPGLGEAVERGDVKSLAGVPGGTAFMQQVDEFIREFGHREGTTWYLSTPTWRRDPAQIWTMICSLAKVDALPANAGASLHQGALESMRRKLRFFPGMPALFRWLADRYRAIHLFEEESHFDLTRPLDALQELAAEWGHRLAQRGLLADPGEVYYLSFDQVRAWLTGPDVTREEVQRVMARNKATYAVASGRWEARRFAAHTKGNELRGNGASAGVARARARIIRGEHEFHRLQKGEVLVCPHTIPSWTPLFVSAAAVVTEVGGVASHAAIVAREYGIPAVMGIAGATQLITDGQEILVDGNTGKVVLGAVSSQDRVDFAHSEAV